MAIIEYPTDELAKLHERIVRAKLAGTPDQQALAREAELIEQLHQAAEAELAMLKEQGLDKWTGKPVN